MEILILLILLGIAVTGCWLEFKHIESLNQIISAQKIQIDTLILDYMGRNTVNNTYINSLVFLHKLYQNIFDHLSQLLLYVRN